MILRNLGKGVSQVDWSKMATFWKNLKNVWIHYTMKYSQFGTKNLKKKRKKGKKVKKSGGLGGWGIFFSESTQDILSVFH